MFHLISIVKSLAVTLVIVLLLQVKIGHDTLEDRAVFWFRSSPLVQPMQKVVDGGVKVVRTAFGKVTGLFDWDLKDQLKQKPGNRDLNFQLERSREYLKEKAEKVAQKLKSEIESKKTQESETSDQFKWQGE